MGRAVLVLGALGIACVGEIGGAATAATDARAAGVDARVAPSVDATTHAALPCATVSHIGDSLSAATVAPLTAAYEAVGATATIDAFGGRAVLQKLAADPRTGKQAALDVRAGGFDGCWVVALGTNDTANIAAGATNTRAAAIDEMMTAIDPGRAARVLWVNTFTTRTSGFYDNANMVLFNHALVEARGRWPNLRVFDWASVAAAGGAPYSDGIHHTAAGYTVRNAAIASALTSLRTP